MRPHVTFRWIGITAVVLAAAGPATAQPGGADAQVGFERRSQLSPQDELTQAEAGLSRMDQAGTTVRRQLEQARASRDVVKTLCLNDKLSQIDVAGRSGKDRQAALQSAVQRNDVELANHEFTIITVLRQRVEQLGAEANQCIGEEIAFVGQSEITTQVDPNLPGEDTTEYPATDPTLVSGPPVPVSSSQ
jgi:hypothetical protein